VILPMETPLSRTGAVFILRGNLGVRWLRHQSDGCGRAAAQAHGAGGGVQELRGSEGRIDDENLDVTADSVLVLQSAGPQGRAGMPEWGAADSEEAVEAGRAGHGADFRCG
jgi:dihydroxy-acid dehydratase